MREASLGRMRSATLKVNLRNTELCKIAYTRAILTSSSKRRRRNNEGTGMYKLFSQRKREEENGVSDVYIYNKFSKEFRNQYFHIIKYVFNSNSDDSYYTYNGSINLWEIACENFAREKGLKYLLDDYGYCNNRLAYEKYVDECSDEDFLDLMDYTFTAIISNKDTAGIVGRAKIDDAIEELNYRFKQHSLGYEFINGNLIEKTNEQIHREIIKPALY